MRCYCVLVHGKLDWDGNGARPGTSEMPAGFLCHRIVLAQTEAEAAEKAYRRVRERLSDWLRDGRARLTLRAEDLTRAPWRRLLERESGLVFYDAE